MSAMTDPTPGRDLREMEFLGYGVTAKRTEKAQEQSDRNKPDHS